MSFRRFVSSNLATRGRWIGWVAALVFVVSLFAQFSLPPAYGAGYSILDLRAQQAQQLKKLDQTFTNLANKAGADAQSLKAGYGKLRDYIQSNSSSQDGRWNDFQNLKSQLGDQIDNVGRGPPKNVLGDMDWRSYSSHASQKVLESWAGDQVETLPGGMGYVNHTRDITLWNPCETAECLHAKIAYYDSFGTQGGLNLAGNKDAIADPYGVALDNMKKLLHAMEVGDYKGVAKSLLKAADYAGLKDDPEFAEILQQADDLYKYKDAKDAGFAKMADSPDVVQQKLNEWTKQALYKLDDVTEVLKQQSETRDALWKETLEAAGNLAETAEQAGNAKVAEWAREWISKIGLVQEGNNLTEQANAATRAKLGEPGNGPGETPDTDGSVPEGPGTGETPSIKAGAVAGALAAGAITLAACLGVNGLDSLLPCAQQACGNWIKDTVPCDNLQLGAFLGALAAASPFAAGLIAGYGGGKGAENIGDLLGNVIASATANNEADQSEAAQKQKAEANLADANAFIGRKAKLEAKVKEIEVDSGSFREACEAALNAPEGSGHDQAELAKKVRQKLAEEKKSLHREIADFGGAFPDAPEIAKLLDGWRERVSTATSLADHMPSCRASTGCQRVDGTGPDSGLSDKAIVFTATATSDVDSARDSCADAYMSADNDYYVSNIWPSSEAIDKNDGKPGQACGQISYWRDANKGSGGFNFTPFSSDNLWKVPCVQKFKLIVTFSEGKDRSVVPQSTDPNSPPKPAGDGWQQTYQYEIHIESE